MDQAMFSFSASLGVLPSLASYNTYKHDFYKWVSARRVVAPRVVALTSLLALVLAETACC